MPMWAGAGTNLEALGLSARAGKERLRSGWEPPGGGVPALSPELGSQQGPLCLGLYFLDGHRPTLPLIPYRQLVSEKNVMCW